MLQSREIASEGLADLGHVFGSGSASQQRNDRGAGIKTAVTVLLTTTK